MARTKRRQEWQGAFVTDAPWDLDGHRLTDTWCRWPHCRLHFVVRWEKDRRFNAPYPATFWWKPSWSAPKSEWQSAVVHHGPAGYYPSKMDWMKREYVG